ncbi:MAG: hypothetical protein JNK76_13430 [Planctomycetales bacterium]|nr:hypothetical protein [Planctomycetales bacterium]MBN8623910.1 hypothetical protein [Planctomycetota bacterium]
MKYRFAFLCALAAICGCRVPFVSHTMPPATMMQHPGPGVDGPGPGVMTIGDPAAAMPLSNSQVAFIGPEGAAVAWSVGQAGMFDSEPLVAPARSNFPQGALYRLKLTDLPGRPGVELYPTIEIAPAVHRTEAYLSHNAIPVQFTEEDLDQVLSGNFVTKVIFLPDPEFQELAVAGVQELVSTRLDPGQDPIVEADRQGAIMAIIRIGNKDLEVPGLEGDVGGFAEGSELYQGVTQAQYGIPITGTPIGLPGPPHIPLGGPAGLQKHVIRNHTFQHYPQPTKKQSIHVKQTPGMSYPKPANKAFVHEHASVGLGARGAGAGAGAAYCP